MSKGVDTFADRLERACKYAGVPYSPTKIGVLIGENKQTVHAWMMGGSIPRADTLFKMADDFGVDPRWLATGDGPEPTPSDEIALATVKEVTGKVKFGRRGQQKVRNIKKS